MTSRPAAAQHLRDLARRPRPCGVTMTGSSIQGIKTVLRPVSDLVTAREVYAALLGVPMSPTTLVLRPRVSTSGWCRAVDRRA
jgi:hypothetical protein